MILKIYDTLSRKLKVFKPIKDKKVRMFVCGVTPYDYAHIGHGRSYVVFDLVAKWLRYLGYKVFYVQNVTDIDDKIIIRARESGKDPLKLAREFEDAYHSDMKVLGVDAVDKFARATDHIKEIINQIQRMFKKGIAYELDDGVYFDTSKFKEYGKLSHQNLKELQKHRIEPHPDKRNPSDFSLWKRAKPGEPSWHSPWGDGRPGWHIEDTAISEKYLSAQYDLHGGGLDLIFPHHEAEIAQMESISGKNLVNYWMHNGFILVNGEKMSKSLGNFTTIRDALRGWKPEVLRLFFASVHYRNPMDFKEESLAFQEKQYEKLSEFVIRLNEIKTGNDNKNYNKTLEKSKKDFESAMNLDFNISGAIASIFELMNSTYRLIESKKFGPNNAKATKDLILKFDAVLGLNLSKAGKVSVPKEILDLVKKREEARKSKNWAMADKIRNEITAKGYVLEDTKEGPRVRKKD